jgi:cyclic di-GMP phosphodiesterase Gmr
MLLPLRGLCHPNWDGQREPHSGAQFTGVKTEPRIDICDAIIELLPIGVTVQDEAGNYILVNGVAAAHHDIVPRETADPSSYVGRSGPAAAPVQDTFLQQSDGTTLLARQRLIEIGGQRLLVSATLDFTGHKEAEDELSRRADFDELTGLPKRALVESYVNDIVSVEGTAARFALVFLDLDDFKHINDYYGHGTGDALLVKLTERLQREIRRSDMLARIGGDEFLLVINPVSSTSEAVATVEHLLQRLKAPFFIDGFEVFASASIGVSLFPDHGSTYGALRKTADSAMYRIKHDTKGAFALFNDEMEREAVVRTELEQTLRLAILDKRFRCAFQPKVDIRTREVIGVEALVRLYNEKGLIQAPGDFIDLATELGLIDELTHLVLEQVMNSLELIDNKFGSDVSISINVAAKQACNLAFMSSFADALAETGCAQRFIIEVTEDAFVLKSLFQSEVLPKLREIGVGVSIDDFGTGYSSLSALVEMTADEIKVDRSFIADVHKRPRSQAILRAIESLGLALGMTVIAEGVQSVEELAYLQAATKIRFAQGYFFSEPVFLDELEAQARDRVPAAGRQRTDERRTHSRIRSARR